MIRHYCDRCKQEIKPWTGGTFEETGEHGTVCVNFTFCLRPAIAPGPSTNDVCLECVKAVIAGGKFVPHGSFNVEQHQDRNAEQLAEIEALRKREAELEKLKERPNRGSGPRTPSERKPTLTGI